MWSSEVAALVAWLLSDESSYATGGVTRWTGARRRDDEAAPAYVSLLPRASIPRRSEPWPSKCDLQVSAP